MLCQIVENGSNGESLGNDDSSGYSGSSDEEGSSSKENRAEDVNAEVNDVIAENEKAGSKEAALEQKIEDSSDDFSKHLSEVGSSTFRAAFMARLDCQSNQVSFDTPTLPKCVKCMVLKGKYLELEAKFNHTKKHHQSIIVDLTKCTKANTSLKKRKGI
ncbi:hypothetical protein Hanom_Chr09g00771621 [Helianthus anomalus]